MTTSEIVNVFYKNCSLAELEALAADFCIAARCKEEELAHHPELVTNVSIANEEVFKMMEQLPGYDDWRGRSEEPTPRVPEDECEPRCRFCEGPLDKDGLCPECDVTYIECPECGTSVNEEEGLCEACGWSLDEEEDEKGESI